MTRTVHDLDTNEDREVIRACRRCGLDDSILAENGYAFYYVVSPNGMAHHADERGGGRTACGIDATGPGWWWPC